VTINFIGLGLIVLAAILIIVMNIIHRKRPYRGFRQAPAFNKLRQAIGLAVEDGSRVHVALGNSSLTGQQGASGLMGLSVLDRIAQYASISDAPPIATTGEGAFSILSQDTLRTTYRNAFASDLYDATQGRMTGTSPAAFVAGTLPVIQEEQISANILMGHFDTQVALLADAAEDRNQFTLAASDSLPAQAVLYAAARESLIGEELFAAGHYLQVSPFHSASLRAQDILRWGIAAAIVLGALYKLIVSLGIL